MKRMDYCRQLDGLLEVDEAARGLGIHVAYTIAWGEPPGGNAVQVIDEEVTELVNEVRKKYSIDELKNNRIIRAYRDFYWRIGIDPTKTRPSSEALVRRVLRTSFPRISPLVDAGNIASVKTLIPIGLYDMRFVTPPLRITLSHGGEVFQPIGGRDEKLDKGVPILVDSQGIVLHLYPHRDSRITMLRGDTSHILILAAGVPGVERWRLRSAVEADIEILRKLGWKSCGIISKP